MTKTIRNLFFLFLIPLILLALYLFNQYSPLNPDAGVNPIETDPPENAIEIIEESGLNSVPDAEGDPE